MNILDLFKRPSTREADKAAALVEEAKRIAEEQAKEAAQAHSQSS